MNKAKKFKHGNILPKLQDALNDHPDFEIKERWIDGDTGKPSGYFVYNNVTKTKMYAGTKDRIFRLASINKDAYDVCVKNRCDIVILFHKNRDGSELPEPQFIVFEIKRIERCHDKDNDQWDRDFPGTLSRMWDFPQYLGVDYNEYMKKFKKREEEGAGQLS